MTFHWLRQIRRRLLGNSLGLKRAGCMKRRRPGRGESLEDRKLMSASGVPAEISEATLAKTPDLPAVPKGAPLLATDTTLVGQLQLVNDQDFVTMKVQANQLYRIDLSVNGINGGKVELKSGDGKTTLATGTVDAEGRLSLEWKATKADTISLRVFSTDAAAKGNYRLTVNRIVDDVADTQDKAPKLIGSFQGHIDHTRDQDWFQVSVTRGDVLKFRLDSVDLAGGRLTIFDAAGKTVLKRMDVATGESHETEWTSDRTGVVKLQITSTTKALGNYTLASERIVDDFGNVKEKPASLTLDRWMEGSLQYNQDIDWFRFQAAAGKKYALRWESTAGEPSEISLYRGKDKAPLAINSLQEDGPGRALFTADKAGDYFIKISRPGITAATAGFRDTVSNIGYSVSVLSRVPHPQPLENVLVDEDAEETVVDLNNGFEVDDPDELLAFTIKNNTKPGLVTATIVDGQLHLQFAENQNGEATITIVATDLSGNRAETTQHIIVTPVEDAPIAQPLPDLKVREDVQPQVIDVRRAFIDPDAGDVVQIAIKENSNPGLVTAVLENGRLTLKFAANGHGPADVTLTGTDLAGHEVETTLHIEVEAVNDAPVVIGRIGNLNANEDGEDISINLDTIFADPDLLWNAESDELTFQVQVNGPQGATLVDATLDGHTLNLHLNPDQFGKADLTVLATDLANVIATMSFRLNVKPVNDAPVVTAGPTMISLDPATSTLVIDLANVIKDVDVAQGVDRLKFQVIDENGVVSDHAEVRDGKLYVQFDAYLTGNETLKVLATDLQGSSVELPVSLSVLDSLGQRMIGGENISIFLEGDLADFSQPEHGTLKRSPDDPNVLIYTPNPGSSGADAFFYRVETEGTFSVGVYSIDVIAATGPRGVAVSEIGRQSATVTFTPGLGDASQFRIDVYELIGNEWKLNEELSRTVSADAGHRAELKNLQTDSPYRVVVTAVFEDLEYEVSAKPMEFTTANYPQTPAMRFPVLGVTDFTVAWNAVNDPGVTGYYVRVQDSSGKFVAEQSVGADELSARFANLKANTAYRVTLSVEYDESALVAGTLTNVTTRSDYPAPSNVAVSEVKYQTATVTFGDPAWGQTSYSVELQSYDAATKSWKSAETKTVDAQAARSVTFTGLNANTSYRAIVTAKDDARGIARSATPVEFKTPDFELVSNVTVRNVTLHDGQATWTAPGWNVTSYTVDVQRLEGGTWKTIDSLRQTPADNITQVSFNKLPAGSHLRVVVTAKNANLNVERTSVSNEFDTPAIPPATNVTIPSVGSTTETVAWTKSSAPIANYRIEYRDSVSLTWKVAGTQPAALASQFQVTNLKPQTSYVFRVVAVDAVTGETANSKEVGPITTLPLPIPGGVNVAPSYQSATVTWNKVDWNPDTYRVEVRNSNGVLVRSGEVSGTSAARFDVTGLDSASSYSVQVIAVRTVESLSAASNATSFQTRAYEAPSGLSYVTSESRNVGRFNATMSWRSVDWASSYTIQQYQSWNGLWGDVATVGSTTTNYTFRELYSNTSYVFRVVAQSVNATKASDGLEVHAPTYRIPRTTTPGGANSRVGDLANGSTR